MVVDDSDGVAAGLIRDSLSVATWEAYSRAWEEWTSLLVEVGVLEEGGELSSVVLYFIVCNYVLGTSAVDRKLVGLAFGFKLRGMGDATKSSMVRQEIKGYRRGRRSSDLRRPVSVAVLRAVLEHLGGVCSSAYEQKLFRAAFLLAFFGALCLGELASPSRSVAGGVLWEDVVFTGASVRVENSTFQEGSGGQGGAFGVVSA